MLWSKMDVVIVVTSKDGDKLERCVTGILKNSKTPINKLFIVAEDLSILNSLSPSNKKNHKIVGVSETVYPFSKNDILRLLNKKESRFKHVSRLYQQLLKMYVFDAIPNIRDNVLILDSDFVFIKPLEFLTSEGKGILACGLPFPEPKGNISSIKNSRIEHAKRLVNNWNVVSPFSGIHHHIIFNRHIMAALFQNVEEYNMESFWKAFIGEMDVGQWASASEYVIYFHYALDHFKNEIETRHLCSVDIVYNSEDMNTRYKVRKLLDELVDCEDPNLVALWCHGFLDFKERFLHFDWVTEEDRKKMLQKNGNMYIFKLDGKGELSVE